MYSIIRESDTEHKETQEAGLNEHAVLLMQLICTETVKQRSTLRNHLNRAKQHETWSVLRKHKIA